MYNYVLFNILDTFKFIILIFSEFWAILLTIVKHNDFIRKIKIRIYILNTLISWKYWRIFKSDVKIFYFEQQLNSQRFSIIVKYTE